MLFIFILRNNRKAILSRCCYRGFYSYPAFYLTDFYIRTQQHVNGSCTLICLCDFIYIGIFPEYHDTNYICVMRMHVGTYICTHIYAYLH